MLSSCSPKVEYRTVLQPEYVFFIPEKIAAPAKPKFQDYDKSKYLYQAPNFSRLQQNTVLLKNYCNALFETVKHYEQAIEAANAKRVRMMEDLRKRNEEKSKK